LGLAVLDLEMVPKAGQRPDSTTTKLKREEREEIKYEEDKTQEGDTSNRIRMGTFQIGLDRFKFG
jgi:hypothetical protein